MRLTTCAAMICAVACALAQPQPNETPRAKKQAVEDSFQAFPLKPGEPVPEVDVHDADGRTFNTRTLKGKYTVFVTGCLT